MFPFSMHPPYDRAFCLLYGPKFELLYRLNRIVKRQNPGKPFNWKGL